MKVFLDTCVFDWILDHPRGPELFGFLTSGRLEAVVCPEVSKELETTPQAKAERRKRLLTTLNGLLPVRPTHIPVAGLGRSGAIISASPRAVELRDKLKEMGFRKLDALHLINAHIERCDLFVTTDKEDIIRRKAILEQLLEFKILQPDELLDRLTMGPRGEEEHRPGVG